MPLKNQIEIYKTCLGTVILDPLPFTTTDIFHRKSCSPSEILQDSMTFDLLLCPFKVNLHILPNRYDLPPSEQKIIPFLNCRFPDADLIFTKSKAMELMLLSCTEMSM